jgi:hypothetical protein
MGSEQFTVVIVAVTCTEIAIDTVGSKECTIDQ